MSSGYIPCACRDCTDVAISDEYDYPVLCHPCEEAGCRNAYVDVTGHGYECQREDAYGSEPEPEEYIYRSHHDRDCPEPWFHNNPAHVCP